MSAGRLISLGGGMTVAGFIASFGGNLSALPMEMLGILVLLVGAAQRPRLSRGIIVRLFGYTVLLASGLLLALGNTTQAIVALAIALAVATSMLWDPVSSHGSR